MHNLGSNKKTARIAGLLYLIVAVCGGFSLMYVPSKLFVWGDATATANNIMASELLFRIDLTSGLTSMTCFILLPLALYKLLQTVNKKHAILMVIFALISIPITSINIVNKLASLMLLNGADYLKVLETVQLHALVMLFLDFYNIGNLIAHIFWGLWLLPLGFLVFKSGFLPRILGVLLIMSCFGYLISFSVKSLFPDYTAITSPMLTFAGIVEMSFCFWLLIKGIKNAT